MKVAYLDARHGSISILRNILWNVSSELILGLMLGRPRLQSKCHDTEKMLEAVSGQNGGNVGVQTSLD